MIGYPVTTGDRCQVTTGYRTVDPAFEDTFNAVDVILSTFDGACPAPNTNVSIGQPINASGTATAKDPDTVNLKVDALYLLKAVRPTGPGDKAPRPLAERTATINSYFVCSAAGSLVPPDAFSCVEAIQPFPGDAVDGYVPNSAFNPH